MDGLNPHWSEVESASPARARRLQDSALREQLAYLELKSRFYAEKLGESVAFSEIDGAEGLSALPFTEKAELRESIAAYPPLGSHLAADPTDLVQVQASSGTTGSPSYVGLTAADVDTWSELGARALFANGFRPGGFCLHGFGMSKGFVGGLPVAQILRHLGVCDIPVGAEAGAERLLRVQADQRPNHLIGTPLFLSYLAEQAPAVVGCEAAALGVEAISVGGEPGGGIPAVRERLEGLWGAPVREMLGGTDIGCVYWGECEQADGMHFLSPDLMVAELIDPVSGEVLAAADGVEAELVYTALRREASPLLRFRSRDHVVVTGTECGCGRTGFKVRCIGRTDDMLIVRGINLFPSAVKDLVAGMEPDTTGEMRIVVDFPGHSTQRPLPVRVEHGAGVAEAELPRLRETIEIRGRSALNVRLAVELVPPGSLGAPGAAKVPLIERVEGS